MYTFVRSRQKIIEVDEQIVAAKQELLRLQSVKQSMIFHHYHGPYIMPLRSKLRKLYMKG